MPLIGREGKGLYRGSFESQKTEMLQTHRLIQRQLPDIYLTRSLYAQK